MVVLSEKKRVKRLCILFKELDGLISLKMIIKRLKTYYFYNELTQNSYYNYYLSNCKNYFSFLKLAKKLIKSKEIDGILNLPKNTSNRYINRRSKPHLLLLALSMPKKKPMQGCKWLPLRNKMHHTPVDFIQAPLKINSYEDILFVLKQLNPFKGYETIDKETAFGYILGMMLSDTSKPEGYSNSNQCLISLTRRYSWNLDIGNNLCTYFRALGIEAHRIRDNDKIRDRAPYGEFRWISEKSPFNMWMLKTCFGLNREQRTTFHAINANWIISAGYEFRKAFLQGLSDGDGCAHNFLRVEISCDPNLKFVVSLLKTFNIKSYIDKDAVCVSNFDSLLKCNSLPIFKYAYGRLEKLNKISKMIKNEKCVNYTKSLKRIIFLLKKQNYSGGQISEYLFDTLRITVKPDYINTVYRKHIHFLK